MPDETTFTPGEWRVDLGLDAVVVGDDDYPPPVLFTSYTMGRDERIANLRLAAAAPKMLDLLKRLRQWDQLPECLDGPYWLVEIGNMIAKATGE